MVAAPGGNAEGAKVVTALKGHSGDVSLMVVLAYSAKEGWCGHCLTFLAVRVSLCSFYRKK